MTKKEIIETIKAHLQNVYHDRLKGIVLYGSEARGDNNIDSDIDILVLLEGPIEYGKDLERNINSLYPLSLELDRRISAKPVDAEEYNKIRCPLYNNAHKEGVLGVKEFARAEWDRALRTLTSAKQLNERDPDSSASRSYYAAFHALTAIFALQDKTFKKHSSLRSAFHKEFIKSGKFSTDLGRAFDFLMDIRETGDYGGLVQVSKSDAEMSISKAELIINEVKKHCPDLLV